MSSKMPNDWFTPTKSSMMLADGFLDGDDNEGVLNQWTSSTVRGVSALPDGIVGGEDPQGKPVHASFGSFDLPNEIMGGNEYDLINLDWLDPSQLPDVSTLPKQVNEVDHQLQEAWGADRRTDGIRLVHAVDKGAAEYAASLEAPVERKRKTAAEVHEAIARGWRQLTAGVSLDNIAQDLVSALGDDAVQAKAAFKSMREEAGLVGPVYVRADAYPKCASGQWSGQVRKTASTASYVVAKPDCGSCVMAQNGRCAALGGLRLVREVPYKHAATVYGGRVASMPSDEAGIKATLKGSLRNADPFATTASETLFPVQSDQTANVSLTAAQDALRAAPRHAPMVADPAFLDRQRRLKLARAKVQAYVREGLLSSEDADHVTKTVIDPSEMLSRAAAMAARPKSASTYDASQMQYEGDRSIRLLSAAGQEYGVIADPEEAAYATSLANARKRVAHYVREGLLDGEVAKLIVASETNPYGLLQRAAFAVLTPAQVRTYDAVGQQFEGDLATRNLKAAGQQHAAIERSTAGDERILKQARTYVARMVKAGLITSDVARQLDQRASNPDQMVRWATAIAVAPKVPAQYKDLTGQNSDARAERGLRKADVAALQAAQADIDRAMADRLHAASFEGRQQTLLERKASAILAQVERGLRGSALAAYIRRHVSHEESKTVGKIIGPTLRKLGALKEERSAPQVYEGAKFVPAQFERRADGPAPQELTKFARWVRQHMTEGAMGKDLDALISSKFGQSVRTAAADTIRALRAEHEGLSGAVYVDAAVYATQTGITGCEAGALRHRANRIPAVLEMDKCGSCAHRVAKEDGTPACSLYSKMLIRSASEVVENPAQYQRKAIYMADAPDSEVLASLMARPYQQEDWGLGGVSDLDNIQVEEETSSEELGEILFGGLKV